MAQEPVHHDIIAQIEAEGLERSQVMFYERLSEEELQESAIVLVTFLYHAATRDAKIPRDLTR